jgi:hypothetical protein
MAIPDLTRSRLLRTGVAKVFKDAGGVLGGVIADPQRDAILFMGIAHGAPVSLPVTGAEQIQRKFDPAKITQLVKARLDQVKQLQEQASEKRRSDRQPKPGEHPARDAARGQRVGQAEEGDPEAQGG